MDNRDPFKLGSLPERDPPPELWRSIEDRLEQPRRNPPLWAVAAGLLLAMGAVWLFLGGVPDRPDQPPDVTEYRMASGILEQRIDALQASVVEARVLGDLGRLENQLAWVDYMLSEAPDDPDLWRHRLDLLESIGGIYAGQAWAVQFEFTSL